MSTSVEMMIARFVAVWGEPPSVHRAMYLGEIRRSLAGYSDHVLAKAADMAIDTRTTWPRPAEIKAIALRAAAMLGRRAPLPPVQRTPQQRAAAEQIMAEFRRAFARHYEDHSTCRRGSTRGKSSVNA